LVLTEWPESGFTMRNSLVPFGYERELFHVRANGTSFYSPTQPFPYEPKAGVGDTGILAKFVAACHKAGIGCFIYWNTNLNINLTDTHIGNLTSAQQEKVIAYNCLALQELLTNYPGLDGIWCDMAGPFAPGSYQRYYNAMKAINPNFIVIGNGNFASAYPRDVATVEERFVTGGQATGYQSTAYQFSPGGYMSQEVIGNPYNPYDYWYEVPDSCPVQPVNAPVPPYGPYVKRFAQPLADYQSFYNTVKPYNCRFLHNMLIGADGQLVQANLDYLDALT
jgi:hypothetical protein